MQQPHACREVTCALRGMRPHCGVRSRLSSESNEQQHAQCKGNATYVSHAKHIAACAGAPANSDRAGERIGQNSPDKLKFEARIGNVRLFAAEKFSFEKFDKQLKFHKIHISRKRPDADYEQIE